MAAMWWAKGAVSARLLTLHWFNSAGKAAPKPHAQADFQGQVPAACWKVLTSRDVSSDTPSLYLLQQRQSVGGGSDSGNSRSRSSSSSSLAGTWLYQGGSDSDTGLLQPYPVGL